ncbi:MAG: hypothetical protein KDC05_04050 [Bacteroidales bacterium]|nr:hypothetical protein [Bacteroidales bacterium]
MRTIIFALFFLGLFGFSLTANAQLSEREDNPSVLKTGTRPVEGNFGLFVGPTFTEISEMIDKDINVRGLPLVNLKYYFTDNVEGRVGIQYYKTKTKIEGDLAEDQVGYVIDNMSRSFFRLHPGFAYHYSPRNILDVYMGAEIPVGTESHKVSQRTESTMEGFTADYMEQNVTKSTFVYGYNLFIGLQAFVADLPFAIGLEYGISGLFHSGLQYEVEYSERNGDNSESMTYYTTENPFEYFNVTRYSDLKYNKFEGGADLRITLSYFFGN